MEERVCNPRIVMMIESKAGVASGPVPFVNQASKEAVGNGISTRATEADMFQVPAFTQNVIHPIIAVL